ncbi:MAG: ribosome biogenesis GTPase YlqF [Clostridiales bacterium]|nr:ribosome biogenesis GTPase YlqF [Clostridiales bacterium]
MDIHWYPGHMTKTRRMIQADLKLVDLVAEVIDARIPISSRNPDIDELVGDKPRLIILNRADQADPEQTRAWTRWFKTRGYAVLETDSKTGGGVNQFSAVIKDALKEQIARWREKGQVGRPVRVMVVGVPNVGKSTFINKVARRKSAKAGDRPGVTRGKQWVAVDAGLDLLDTPGILWPKFEDQTVGWNLAFTGAIKDEVMDAETLACYLMETLAERYPQALLERYKLELPPRAQDEETGGLSYGYDLLERAARKRGFLISGGEPDTERMAKVLLDEFRAGRLGRFTLETPEGAEAYGDD